MIVTDFDAALKELKNYDTFIFDVESTGLDLMYETHKICGIGIKGYGSEEAWFFPVRMEGEKNVDTINFPDRIPEIVKLLESSKVIIGQNIKFDIKGMFREGMDVGKIGIEYHDLLPMYRLYSKEFRPGFKLTEMIAHFYSSHAADFDKQQKDYIKKNKLKRFSLVPVDMLGFYCTEQLRYTEKIYNTLKEHIVYTNQTEVWELEKRTTRALLLMEIVGAPIDLKYCKMSIEHLNTKAVELEKEIFEGFGREFNINSGDQVGDAFHSINVHSPMLTAKGKESWADKAITMMDHPMGRKIREYRSVKKLNNTYFEPFYSRQNGRLYCGFSNWGTITGRLSCREPNLQNIPRFTMKMSKATASDDKVAQQVINMVKTGIGGSSSTSWAAIGDATEFNDEEIIAVRRAFINEPDRFLFSLDFSQMEIMDLIYYLPNKEEIYRVIREGTDFHSYMAMQIFGVTKDDPNFKLFRQFAKGITFGLIYGMGLDTLASAIGKTRDEAKEIREIYFNKLQGVREFIRAVQDKVIKRGYVKNLYGRRYYIDPEFAYKGVNYLVQGSSADIVKDRMAVAVDYLMDKKSKIIVQIHDELLVLIHKDEMSVLKDIKNILETNKFGIPLTVDVERCTHSWAEKVDYKFE